MKRIKIWMMALAAAVIAVGFNACNKNEEEISNYERYQQSVDNTVKSGKKHNKVILLVAFGSTWQRAFLAFDNTVKEYQKAFPDYDVFLSFSSAICINRAAAGEHAKDEGENKAEKRHYYAPNFWLEAFGRVKYSEIIVQSLQVIPGEEYGRVINYMKDFANNSQGDLDDAYLKKLTLRLGLPLMADADKDVENLAKALDKNYANFAKQGIVAFMGHGNPDSYDIYKANIRYTQLEQALQKINKNYYVGTVDMKDNFKTFVRERMEKAGVKKGSRVYCTPLMSISGDHAHNDMAGNDCAKTPFQPNDEGEVEDTSWKMYFKTMGYDCSDQTQIMTGLLERADVRQLWMNHTKNAEKVDYYHSKNPE